MPIRATLGRLFHVALLLTFPFGELNAEEVTLTLKEGGFTVIGELLASNPPAFLIKNSKLGVLALEMTKFDCSGAACPKPAPVLVSIHGSNTIGSQLMPSTIERFSEEQGYTVEKILGRDAEEVQFRLTDSAGNDVSTIDLQSHGSGTAPSSLAGGKAQIGEMSRPITTEELSAVEGAGVKVKTNIFALDGIVVLVSPQNSLKALSLEDMSKVFSGEITDWAQLGAAPGKINVYARDGKSGTFDTFNSLVLKPRNVKMSSEARVFEGSADLSDVVARDRNGIGFAGFAYIRNAKPLAISSTCGIVSSPDVFTVKTEDYPLARRLFLYSADSLSPMGKRLVDYALSDKAQDVISEAGFINQQIDAQAFEQQAGRFAPALLVADKDFNFQHMRDLVRDLQNARRLSVNFRFQRSSSTLDERVLQDIPRLARLLRSDPGKYKEILLLGFTDNTGSFESNRVISANRAASFKSALVAEGVAPERIAVKAYSHLLPVGCNDTEAGRAMNRRVEVWVKE